MSRSDQSDPDDESFNTNDFAEDEAYTDEEEGEGGEEDSDEAEVLGEAHSEDAEKRGDAGLDDNEEGGDAKSDEGEEGGGADLDDGEADLDDGEAGGEGGGEVRPEDEQCPCPADVCLRHGDECSLKESCACSDDVSSDEPAEPEGPCDCGAGLQGVVHSRTCVYFTDEVTVIKEPDTCACDTPPTQAVCTCCRCPVDRCTCQETKDLIEDFREKQARAGDMPAVLEPTHPLMQRFQQTLKTFLERENALAEEEIVNLRDELRLSKEQYDKDLEMIYRSDHDTNGQRVLIEEYEANLAKMTANRQKAEATAKATTDRYRRVKEQLDKDMVTEREALQELEALTSLCRQLDEWRTETESNLTVSHRMSDKMRKEKQALADEKRQLDMFIFGLNNEVWRLESKIEMIQKQIEIKSKEMEKTNDKVVAYATELEDLDMDKRRLVSLWNSVLVNIQQRDKVYDSVRDDCRNLQENYRTLISNLEITKKVLEEEMQKGKEIEMEKDKVLYDTNIANKQYEAEESKTQALEARMVELKEAIEMCERDQNLIKMENQTLSNYLRSTEKEVDRKVQLKRKMESEVLDNLQECMLNDKAVQFMASGIKKLRDLARKHEISLMAMETQHSKMMLDIEVYRTKDAKSKTELQEMMQRVREKEKEVDGLEEKYEEQALTITRKQRELDNVNKKLSALKDIFGSKTPQQLRVEDLENQIRALRERTDDMQQEWLRLQGHVVKLASQHQKLSTDINLINKQIQICDQKAQRIQAECEHYESEGARVERSLRDLNGRLGVMQKTRKDFADRNAGKQHAAGALTHEYEANLKDAEMEILQLEDEIEDLEKEKRTLAQELDRAQRQALNWQRKGIMALELKKNITDAKSGAGEIGRMKNEIHRMEVRREQLRKCGEKLAEDLAHCVTIREKTIDKVRAQAAVEQSLGAATPQFQYHHKLRLAKADVARVTKELAETNAELSQLQAEQAQLERQVVADADANRRLEETVAELVRGCIDADREKKWLLERIVRSQRLGKELSTAVKRQSLKPSKPQSVVFSDYNNAKIFNRQLVCITETLSKEYPVLEDRLKVVLNTLEVETPSSSPRLPDICTNAVEPAGSEDRLSAERPFSP